MSETFQSFLAGKRLTEGEFLELLRNRSPEKEEWIRRRARELQRKHYGNRIYIRGLIEFTNYCKNNCYYCGIRAGNCHAIRYRLTQEEILSCCERGYGLGFRTFVLQGGEDPYFTDQRMVALVEAIKKEFPDCALTLSVGEKERSSYQAYFDAGADRYLLRHETADRDHYRTLHPENLTLENRLECLRNLREIGYQTGCGFMVGSPGQTLECLAKDLYFLQEFRPHMVGIGPFIPHHDTGFAGERAGSVEDTRYLLSMIRVILPEVLLPATTALATIAEDGREQGILAGANVIMPNLSPENIREQYALYDNKLHTGEEAAEHLRELKERMRRIGYEIVTDRGDSKIE